MDPRGPQRAGAPVTPTTITSTIADVDKSLLDTVVDDNWHGVGSTVKNNNRLLFLTVEYVDDNQSRDYSKVFSPYEQVSFYSPRAPSPLSDFEHSQVSPLDPNMSSTARYSPTPVPQLPSLSFPNSVVVLPDPPSPLIIPSDGHVRTNINSYISSHNNTIQNVVQSADNTAIDFVNADPHEETLVTSVNGELILMRGPNVELESTSSSSSSRSAETASAGPLMLAEIPETEFTLTRDFLVMHDEDQLNVVNSLASQSGGIKEKQIIIGDHMIDEHQTKLLKFNHDDAAVIPQEQVIGKILKNNIESAKIIPSVPASGKIILRKNKKQIRNKTTSDYEECVSPACLKSGECTCRNVRTISDQPVPSRAVATLPGSYLAINKLPLTPGIGEPIGFCNYGVFAKRNIRQRTQFGPIEGILYPYSGESFKKNQLPLLYETNEGHLLKVDVSDENTSNWMRFVRPALTYDEQNLVICQQTDGIFFLTTRNILSKEELKAGPSSQYALRRGFTILESDLSLKDKEIFHDENNINEWQYSNCETVEPFKPIEKLESLDIQCNENEVDNKSDFEQNKSKSPTNNKKLLKVTDGQTVLYPCPQCTKVFPRSYSLKRHMHMHLSSKTPQKYECSICGENFLHPYNRSRHMKIFHSDETREKENARKSSSEYKCKFCNLAFKKLSLLNIHKLIHEQDANKDDESSTSSLSAACPQCEVTFNAWHDLINHVSSKHGRIKSQTSKVNSNNNKNKNNNNNNNNNNNQVASPIYKCRKCYKRFATRVRLQQHFLVHGAEDQKPLPCNVCCKRFMNNSALSCHLKTHRQDKQLFECPMCRKLFYQVLMLKEHVETHRGEDGIFSCPHCPRTFTKYSVIRKHIRAHHCERKHKCQVCSKQFRTIDKLRMHLLRHSDHREFHCANCGKQFKRKDKLKEHMTRMHNAQRVKREQLTTKSHNNNNNNNNNNTNNNNNININDNNNSQVKKFIPKVNPTDYNRFIYKCHQCLVGFKRRGMLVNHLAKRHPDVSPDSIPELNLPILRQTRDYFCQYCDKVYKSSSKRKAHIMKNHPGADSGLHNSTFSQTVGSVPTVPQGCQWCHKQYASKAKLLQHQRKKHAPLLNPADKIPRPRNRSSSQQNNSSTLDDNNFIMSDYIQGYDTDVDFIKPKILKMSEDTDFIDNEDDDDGDDDDNHNLELAGEQFIRICDIR